MTKKIENILGIEIGGTKIQLLLENPAGEIISREHYVADAKAGATGILNQIEQGIELFLQRVRLMLLVSVLADPLIVILELYVIHTCLWMEGFSTYFVDQRSREMSGFCR